MKFEFNPLSRFGLQLITTSLNFNTSVPTYADLPLVGNTASDARITEDTGHLYIWNGSSWVDQGASVTINWTSIIGKPTSTPTEIDNSVALASTALQNSVIDTDPTLTADSDSQVASQKATKAYVESKIGSGGEMHFSTMPPIQINNQPSPIFPFDLIFQ